MEVIITRQFAKDVEKGLDKNHKLKLASIIDQLRSAPDLQALSNIKKLKGYKTAYRIKMDDFRIGFLLEDNKIFLSRVMNRKDEPI